MKYYLVDQIDGGSFEVAEIDWLRAVLPPICYVLAFYYDPVENRHEAHWLGVMERRLIGYKEE